MTRDGLSREAAEQRINSQMPQEQKKKYADFLIDTSGDFDSTRAQAQAVYEELQRIST
jgi:dephospho-CoA kinase